MDASNNGATLPPLEISVAEFIGNNSTALYEHGEVVYELIFDALKQNRPVRLSYKGVEYVSTIFNQTAVGRLYKKFKPKKIEELLEVVNSTERHKTLLDIDVRGYRQDLKLSRKRKKEIEAIINGERDF